MASMAAKPRNSHSGPAAPVQPAQINGNGIHAPIGVGVSTSGVGYTQHSQAELSPLWQSVGLETLSGVHNYDPRCLELERVELEALHDEFLAHRKLFGFQADNVRNQMEHLCFLIQNARDRYGPAAYQYLHNRYEHTQDSGEFGTARGACIQLIVSLVAVVVCVCSASSRTTVVGASTSTPSAGVSRSV
jgi:hypothetical protein